MNQMKSPRQMINKKVMKKLNKKFQQLIKKQKNKNKKKLKFNIMKMKLQQNKKKKSMISD